MFYFASHQPHSRLCQLPKSLIKCCGKSDRTDNAIFYPQGQPIIFSRDTKGKHHNSTLIPITTTAHSSPHQDSPRKVRLDLLKVSTISNPDP
jgi:hypothetical protein